MSIKGYFDLSLLGGIHSVSDLQNIVGSISEEDCAPYFSLDEIYFQAPLTPSSSLKRPRRLEDFDVASFFSQTFNSAKEAADRDFVKVNLGSFQQIVKETLRVLDETFPLFIEAFKCYQTASAFFLNRQEEDAMREIGVSGRIAQDIFQKMTALSNDMMNLRAKMNDEMVKFLEKGKGQYFDKLNVQPLTTFLLNISTFFDYILLHANDLGDPDLANPLMVEAMKISGSEATETFFRVIKVAENRMPALLPKPETMADVVKKMKTGLRGSAPIEQTKVVDELRLISPDGIEANFALSFSRWLAFAKIHAIAQETFSGVLKAVDGLEDQFALLEKLDQNG